MRIQLAGLPLSAHRRLYEESSGWTDAVPGAHHFSPTPASSSTPNDLSSSDRREILRKVEQGYVHIVMPGIRAWKDFRRCIEFECRIHILRLPSPLRQIQWSDLRSELHRVVELEEKWLQRIGPSDVNHALLLPPDQFEPEKRCANYWHHCDVYAESGIEKAESILQAVKSHHRKPDGPGRSWLDSRSLRFRIDPSRHGLSPNERSAKQSYRFCFAVPLGFHFDVSHDKGRQFTLIKDGAPHRFTRVNVTPWGHLR